MGNLFSSNKYNLSNFELFKDELGTLDEPKYAEENQPSNLSGLFNLNIDIVKNIHKYSVPENDKELLNRFLVEIATTIKLVFNKEDWEKKCFSEKVEGGNFVDSSVLILDDGEIKNNAIELLTEKVGNSNVKHVYKASCIYLFQEDTLQSYTRYRNVPYEECYLGLNNGNVEIMSYNYNEKNTNKLEFSWYIYHLDDDSVYTLIYDVQGIDDQKYEVINPLKYLEEAKSHMDDKNDKAMDISLKKFKKWRSNLKKNNTELVAKVGGNEIGTLILMDDFFSKLELFDDEKEIN